MWVLFIIYIKNDKSGFETCTWQLICDKIFDKKDYYFWTEGVGLYMINQNLTDS